MTSVTTMVDKFNAAVHVIQNLPKDGPFQPSNDMKLRFYSHFKQATVGPCCEPRPAFWEVVKKAKWDAWSRLGDMSKENAMINYIDDLKKIIETMPYTENSADFTDKLGPFYEIIDLPISYLKEKVYQAHNKGKDAVNVNGNAIGDAVNNNNVKETGLSNGISKDTSFIKSPPSSLKDLSSSRGITSNHQSYTGVRDAQSEKFYSGTESDDDEFSDPLQSDSLEYQPVELLASDIITNDSGFGVTANSACERLASNEEENKTSSSGALTGLFSFRKFQHNGNPPNNDTILANGFDDNGELEVNNRVCTRHDAVIPNGVAHKGKLSNGPIDGVARRGGGDPTASSSSGRMHRNSDRQIPLQTGKAYSLGNIESLPMADRPRGSSGGGQRRGPGGSRPPYDVNEQIAETLFQLQKDMESVLIRLNTLEALTVAHHNIAQGRIISVLPTESESSSLPVWWPFRNMSFKTVAIFLAWPVVLHLVINLILSNRARRALRKRRPM